MLQVKYWFIKFFILCSIVQIIYANDECCGISALFEGGCQDSWCNNNFLPKNISGLYPFGLLNGGFMNGIILL